MIIFRGLMLAVILAVFGLVFLEAAKAESCALVRFGAGRGRYDWLTIE